MELLRVLEEKQAAERQAGREDPEGPDLPERSTWTDRIRLIAWLLAASSQAASGIVTDNA